jgi:superfamily I DNA/RNA helicase
VGSGAARSAGPHGNGSADTARRAERALEQLDTGSLTIPRTADIVARFRELKARLAALEGLEGGALVGTVFPPDQPWAEPIRAVVRDFEEDGQPASLLELAQRGVTQPELPTDVDYVRVMSLHKSKGLTADLVIVVGCIEGLIPHLPRELVGTDRERSLQEQRRLFYVAITRTRSTLVLSSVTRLPAAEAYQMRAIIPGYGNPRNLQASRFISELGPSCPAAVPGDRLLPGRR